MLGLWSKKKQDDQNLNSKIEDHLEWKEFGCRKA